MLKVQNQYWYFLLWALRGKLSHALVLASGDVWQGLVMLAFEMCHSHSCLQHYGILLVSLSLFAFFFFFFPKSPPELPFTSLFLATVLSSCIINLQNFLFPDASDIPSSRLWVLSLDDKMHWCGEADPCYMFPFLNSPDCDPVTSKYTHKIPSCLLLVCSIQIPSKGHWPWSSLSWLLACWYHLGILPICLHLWCDMSRFFQDLGVLSIFYYRKSQVSFKTPPWQLTPPVTTHRII